MTMSMTGQALDSQQTATDSRGTMVARSSGSARAARPRMVLPRGRATIVALPSIHEEHGNEEELEESPSRGTRVAWVVGGGLVASAWFALTSGHADSLLYMLHCALAG